MIFHTEKKCKTQHELESNNFKNEMLASQRKLLNEQEQKMMKQEQQNQKLEILFHQSSNQKMKLEGEVTDGRIKLKVKKIPTNCNYQNFQIISNLIFFLFFSIQFCLYKN